MKTEKTPFEEREESILDAAAALIIRFGYDKTTMSDIAAEAGVTRAIVYLHFENKEALFEALLSKETLKYLDNLLQAYEADARGGNLSGFFRCVLYAVQRSPFMSALMIQDRRFFGSYLKKPENIFHSLQSDTLWSDTLKQLQAVGALRADFQPSVVAHIMQALSIGLIYLEEKGQGDSPPFTDVLETIAGMIESLLTSEEKKNNAAGDAIIRRIAIDSRNQFIAYLQQTDVHDE